MGGRTRSFKNKNNMMLTLSPNRVDVSTRYILIYVFVFVREGPSPRGAPSIPPLCPSFFQQKGSI
jgi:hypothetical protein